jgi:hypothetical protein
MSTDALSQLIAQQDREDEERTYKGKASWTKREVDQAVGELAEDARVAVALRRSAGIFERAGMYYTSALLRHAAKALEVVSE